MVSRGSEKVGKLPDMGYVVNRKSDVWSDNVAELYEEVKARRWVPATDIPWTELHTKPLPHDLEMACAQLYTFLQECQIVSMDFPSKWVPLINQDFLELKSWMCAQMLDASRLFEVFRKRALFGGAGLGRASATAEQGLEPMIIICGGGLEKAQVDKGRIATAKFIRLAVKEYMERIAAAGLTGHAKRSKIPAMIDRISAAA